jgi:hypothetical protein
MRKQAKKQARKRSASHKHRKISQYEVPGAPISREDLLSRSELEEKMLDYCVEQHLIPNKVRVSGAGTGSTAARYEWRTGHLRYCALVANVRAAGGSYTLAALRIIAEGLPFPQKGMSWLRKALQDVTVRQFGEKATSGSVRHFRHKKRITADMISERVSHPDGLSDQDQEREGQYLTYEAHQYSPTQNAAGGMERAQSIRATIARVTLGRRLPEDAGLPDLSIVRFLDILESVSDDDLWRAYDDSYKYLLTHPKHIMASLRRVPLFTKRSEAEMVETLLPYPGVFSNVKLTHALLPIGVLARLIGMIDPEANDEARVLSALFELRLRQDTPPLPELPATSFVDALPIKEQGASIV